MKGGGPTAKKKLKRKNSGIFPNNVPGWKGSGGSLFFFQSTFALDPFERATRDADAKEARRGD